MMSLPQGEALVEVEAYRGEHGHRGLLLQTRLASISFGSHFAATEYARSPNRREDVVVDPRIVRGLLTMERPFLNTPDDPFLELDFLGHVLGVEQARSVACQFHRYIEETDHWRDTYAQRHESVESLITQMPTALSDLYLLAYPVLDNHVFIDVLRKHGFDGAIHGGSGCTAGEGEYKLFDRSQIKVLDVLYLNDMTLECHHLVKTRVGESYELVR